jgi:hypothetical protein
VIRLGTVMKLGAVRRRWMTARMIRPVGMLCPGRERKNKHCRKIADNLLHEKILHHPRRFDNELVGVVGFVFSTILRSGEISLPLRRTANEAATSKKFRKTRS